MIESAIGFVLAGGQSTRMGTDKALVDFCGKPLIAHAIDCLRNAGLSAQIAGARSDLAAFAPVVHDPAPDRGPLAGICSALAQCSADLAVFLSVDMPLIPVSLVQYLKSHAVMTASAVTVASVNGFAQTFPAAVRRDALPVLQRELECGAGGCFEAFTKAGISVVPVEMLVQTGQVRDQRGSPAYRWFWNVNTREELERVQRETHSE